MLLLLLFCILDKECLKFPHMSPFVNLAYLHRFPYSGFLFSSSGQFRHLVHIPSYTNSGHEIMSYVSQHFSCTMPFLITFLAVHPSTGVKSQLHEHPPQAFLQKKHNWYLFSNLLITSFLSIPITHTLIILSTLIVKTSLSLLWNSDFWHS